MAYDTYLPDENQTKLATVIANINVFASNPATSEGEGEIVYNSTDNKVYVNTGTASSPTWTELGSGGSSTGTDSTTFTLDQDNTGAGVDTALDFNRGSTGGDARLKWDETNDRFVLYEETPAILAEMRTKQLDVQVQVNFDDTTGTVYVKKNGTTGDLELHVATGDCVKIVVG